MAGHSKWAQIKRAKAVTDGARSRVFSRFAREITLESKKAAGNPSSPSLIAVIERARAANMPKENIERAIAKGNGAGGSELEPVAYELYGPGSVAIIVSAVTDSRNRTTQEMKHLLTKNGYVLGAPGSSLWAFAKTPAGNFIANDATKMTVEGVDETKLAELLTMLDDYDDTQNVFTNAHGYESTDIEP